jgi:hypothetical protein
MEKNHYRDKSFNIFLSLFGGAGAISRNDVITIRICICGSILSSLHTHLSIAFPFLFFDAAASGVLR